MVVEAPGKGHSPLHHVSIPTLRRRTSFLFAIRRNASLSPNRRWDELLRGPGAIRESTDLGQRLTFTFTTQVLRARLVHDGIRFR